MHYLRLRSQPNSDARSLDMCIKLNVQATMLLTLSLCALPAFAQDRAAALERVQACSESVGTDVSGIDALERACPGIRSALAASGLSDGLYSGWERDIDGATLDDLLSLRERYAQSPPSSGPNLQALHHELAGLQAGTTKESVTWWDKVKAWLRKVFTPNSTESPSWLERLFRHVTVSETVMSVIFYGAVALVIGGAIAIVVNELRAAGVLGKRLVRVDSPLAADSANLPASTSVADYDAAGWYDKPRLLLRLIVAQLVRQRRLQAERSLTHRELVRQAKFEQVGDDERFKRLALLAERMQYGDAAAAPSQSDTDSVLADARRLLGDAGIHDNRPKGVAASS